MLPMFTHVLKLKQCQLCNNEHKEFWEGCLKLKLCYFYQAKYIQFCIIPDPDAVPKILHLLNVPSNKIA
ncbi:hypothetical protein T4B_5882 [Trichinella pseudospiralis]|uniref:Uncharacterized protein n=1 Tax=Trichinella pseudospiralis TaxID=6337 RepID=A0A0V1JH43_TRIPS|nr:hypothetical protein T4B_5882 [Trichinella pseudospiralis]